MMPWKVDYVVFFFSDESSLAKGYCQVALKMYCFITCGLLILLVLCQGSIPVGELIISRLGFGLHHELAGRQVLSRINFVSPNFPWSYDFLSFQTFLDFMTP